MAADKENDKAPATVKEIQEMASKLRGVASKLDEKVAEVTQRNLQEITTSNWKSAQRGLLLLIRCVGALSAAIDELDIQSQDDLALESTVKNSRELVSKKKAKPQG